MNILIKDLYDLIAFNDFSVRVTIAYFLFPDKIKIRHLHNDGSKMNVQIGVEQLPYEVHYECTYII